MTDTDVDKPRVGVGRILTRLLAIVLVLAAGADLAYAIHERGNLQEQGTAGLGVALSLVFLLLVWPQRRSHSVTNEAQAEDDAESTEHDSESTEHDATEGVGIDADPANDRTVTSQVDADRPDTEPAFPQPTSDFDADTAPDFDEEEPVTITRGELRQLRSALADAERAEAMSRKLLVEERGEHSRTIAELETDRDSAVAQATLRHDTAMAQLRAQRDSELAELRTTTERTTTAIQERLTLAQNRLEAAQTELARRRAQLITEERERARIAFATLRNNVLADLDGDDAVTVRRAADRILAGLDRLWQVTPQAPEGDRAVDAPQLPPSMVAPVKPTKSESPKRRFGMGRKN